MCFDIAAWKNQRSTIVRAIKATDPAWRDSSFRSCVALVRDLKIKKPILDIITPPQ
jgi:hypothetical protein